MRRRARLTINPDEADAVEYTFIKKAIVGRRRGPDDENIRRVAIHAPSVSGRHCTIRQDKEGRFFARDQSRNGTWLEGRRLVPNVEMEVHPGQKVQIATGQVLLLTVDDEQLDVDDFDETIMSTLAVDIPRTEVTILVGDIRQYTTMNQAVGPEQVYSSVSKTFEEIERVILEYDGAIKEYQGDAILAFWERRLERPDQHVLHASEAALAVHRTVLDIAENPDIWSVPGFDLRMDWALTTGDVLISTMGGDRPTGLAMVGDVVNYAYRLEKLVDDINGPIVACERTYQRAKSLFKFRPLGEKKVKGRKTSEPVYRLCGPLVGTLEATLLD